MQQSIDYEKLDHFQSFQDNQKTSEESNSDFTTAYLRILPKSISLLPRQQYESMLLSQGIRLIACLEENNQCKHISRLALKSSQQSAQIISLQMHLSVFRFQINLLNVKGKNPFLNNLQIKRGNFGSLYIISFLNEMAAIKIFRAQNENLLPTCVNSAIKEYGIAQICSALKCGPFLNKIFGFDLIVYEDSVMFSMERCRQLQCINAENIRQLKLSMKIMHSFGIIHFDVKPDNIMYSNAFKKLVFIDFGFSQVVEINIGTKMPINFRGSPAFCCEEMLINLGQTQCQNYVDVYYNDALGLQLSIKHCQAQMNYCEWITEQPDILALDEDTYNSLLIYLLKYNCFAKQSAGVILLLKSNNNSLLQKKGRQIMRIFQKNVSVDFFERIYAQLYKQIHKFLELGTIQTFFKDRKFAARGITKQFNEDQLSKTDFSKRFQLKSIQRTNNSAINEKYRQFLLIQNIFCHSLHFQQARHILIQYLRFDIKNNTLAEKNDVAIVFNASEGLQANTQHDKVVSLTNIRYTFKLLFEYCLCPPHSIWKKQHIFIILTQLIMLDFSLQSYLEQLLQLLLQLFVGLFDRIKCSIELVKLTNLQDLKHKSDYQFMKVIFPYKLYTFGRKLLEQALQNHKDECNFQHHSLVTAFRLFMNLKNPLTSIQIFSKISYQISHIKDNKFRQQTLQFLYLQLLLHYHEQQRYELTFHLLHNAKQFTFYKHFRQNVCQFHYSAYYIINILILTKDFKEMHRFLQRIAEAISCPAIIQKFKFQMCIFLFSSDNNMEKIKIYSEDLLQNPNYLATKKLSAQFCALIQKIKFNTTFIGKYPKVIENILITFSTLNRSLESYYQDQLTIAQIQKIMYRYNILSFLEKAAPKTIRNLLQQQLARIEALIQNQQMSNIKKMYYKIEVFIYQAVYFTSYNNYFKVLQNFQLLYQIVKHTKDHKTQHYFLQKIIMTSLILGLQDKILPYVYEFWNISTELATLTRYFQFSRCCFITISLHQFQRNRDLQTFYQFLTAISQYLTKYPLEEYFQQLITNMRLLMKKRKYLQLMTFETLSSIFDKVYWNNHYFVTYFIFSLEIETNRQTQRIIFIKIIKYLPFLHNFAKQAILETYFRFAIPYFNNSQKMNNYMLVRWGLRFLQKRIAWSWLKPKMKKLKKRMNSFFIDNFRLKIRHLIAK